MLLFIGFAALVAKFKGYRVLRAIKTVDLLPLALVELVYIFFQANAFLENYTYVRFARQIQAAFILALLLPIIRRRLYKQSLWGAACVFVGSMLNRTVISANGGKMPVYPTFSKITGYYKTDALSKGIDSLHVMMTSVTKLNILADYIDTGFSIMSIGDLFIHAFVGVVVYYTIKSGNLEKVSA